MILKSNYPMYIFSSYLVEFDPSCVNRDFFDSYVDDSSIACVIIPKVSFSS